MTCGFQQEEDVDFFDTFAPVVKWSTIRAILAFAIHKMWTIQRLDVITAFLSGLIYEEIFMEISPSFSGPGSEGKVYKLLRALYGLKYVPRTWYSKMDSYLVTQDLTKSITNPNLHYSIINWKYAIVLLYVDNFSALVTIQQTSTVYYLSPSEHLWHD